MDTTRTSIAFTSSIHFSNTQPGEKYRGRVSAPLSILLGPGDVSRVLGLTIYTGGHDFIAELDLDTGVVEVTPPVGGGAAAAATLTCTLGAANTDRRWTAVQAGYEGNRLLLDEPWPLPENNPLSVSIIDPNPGVKGFKYIRIRAATDAGTRQVETATLVGNAAANGNLALTITSGLIAGAPLTVQVPVLLGDTPEMQAVKARTKLRTVSALTTKYVAGGTLADVSLTSKNATTVNHDPTLNIAITNGSPSPGITPVPSSVHTTTGVLPGVISTVEDVRAKVEATPSVAAVVTLTHINGSTGAGIYDLGQGNTIHGGRDAFLVVGGDNKQINGDPITDGVGVGLLFTVTLTPYIGVATGTVDILSTYPAVPDMSVGTPWVADAARTGGVCMALPDCEGGGIITLSASDNQCPGVVTLLHAGV